MQRGQYIRLLLASSSNPNSYIAAAKEMNLHLSAQTEESSTKDTTGDALEYEVTGLSYEITGSALVLSGGDSLLTGGQGLSDMMEFTPNQLLYWKIALVNGDNNRTVVQDICSGTAKLTNLQINAQNRQNTNYSYTLKGQGAIVVAGNTAQSAPSNSPAPESVTLDPEDGNEEG